MMYENVLYEERGSIAIVTVNRPQVRNAISIATMHEFDNILRCIASSTAIRVVILTGAGDRAFVAGGDLKEFQSLKTIYDGRAMSLLMQSVLNRLESLDQPVLVAMNGDAYGGGCEVALAGDMRIAAEDVKIGFLQVKLGIMTAWGGSQRLLRLVGRSRAIDLLVTGRIVTASEALALGLVDRVAPSRQALAVTLELAETIATRPPLAVRCLKRVVRVGADALIRTTMEYEAELFSMLWVSEDHNEAVEAMREKRDPVFRGM